MSTAVSCSIRHRLPLARTVFALAAVLAAATSAVNTAQAQAWAGRGSWCVDPIDGPGFDCSF